MWRAWVVLLVLVLTGCGTPPAVVSSAPAGLRAVTFDGLTFDVPVQWGLNRARCGTPVADTVMLPGVQLACAHAGAVRVSSLTFSRSSMRTGGTRSDLDGHPAYRYTGSSHGLHTLEIVVPDLDAVATIASPSLATVHQVAGTAAVTTRDANGCASRRHDTAVLPTDRPAVRAGADRSLIPGHPSAVAVCRYADGGWLEQSAKAKAVARFVATFDRLPAGLSRADPRTYSPIVCTQPTDGYVVQVRYSNGPPLTVWARIAQCGELGASNGTATGQRAESLVTALVHAAGASTGWPGVGPA